MKKFEKLQTKFIVLISILTGLLLLYCCIDFSLSYSDLANEVKQIEKITEWQKTNITRNLDGIAITIEPGDFYEFLDSFSGTRSKYFMCVESMVMGMQFSKLSNDDFEKNYFYQNFALENYGLVYKGLLENEMVGLLRKFCAQLFFIVISFGVSLALIFNFFDKKPDAS